MIGVGCCCDPTLCTSGNATIRFHVTGCFGAALSGASVSITDGTHTFSGTTNGSGDVSLSVDHSGTYTYTVSATNYATATGSIGVVCGATPAVTGVTLTPATGYVCGNPCCNCNPAPCLVDTPQSTVVFNDGIGNVTLTLSGGAYYGSASRPIGAGGKANDFSSCPTVNVVGSGNVNVYFSADCTGHVTVSVFPGGCSGACQWDCASTPGASALPALAGQENTGCTGMNITGTATVTTPDCPSPALSYSGTASGGWAPVGPPVDCDAYGVGQVYGLTPTTIGGVPGFIVSVPFTVS